MGAAARTTARSTARLVTRQVSRSTLRLGVLTTVGGIKHVAVCQQSLIELLDLSVSVFDASLFLLSGASQRCVHIFVCRRPLHWVNENLEAGPPGDQLM